MGIFSFLVGILFLASETGETAFFHCTIYNILFKWYVIYRQDSQYAIKSYELMNIVHV